MLIAVRWLQLKMPWKWQPRLCLKLVVAPILMLICNDLIFAAKMSWNLLGCLSWTIGKSRISARIWFCLRLGVETGAVEERLASIRRMLSVRLWDVDRAAERIQTKDIWFILMYSHGFQHDLATPHGKNRRIWKIRREREREREFANMELILQNPNVEHQGSCCLGSSRALLFTPAPCECSWHVLCFRNRWKPWICSSPFEALVLFSSKLDT